VLQRVRVVLVAFWAVWGARSAKKKLCGAELGTLSRKVDASKSLPAKGLRRLQIHFGEKVVRFAVGSRLVQCPSESGKAR